MSYQGEKEEKWIKIQVEVERFFEIFQLSSGSEDLKDLMPGKWNEVREGMNERG